ncbi:hypothetical protein T265_07821 [Opisthorchis viverrini]|uniref:Uncharacterized protein n=1 Tax=Opisthorchis viverrini TaxID=6198 RepID=A0A074ZMG7_OPIVI|nr:hypothetical protein T265_07821 [Opisthorchis viverrini]KER24555.1 hypothetical protein T265_07821 [Opisthorchis viverrini]
MRKAKEADLPAIEPRFRAASQEPQARYVRYVCFVSLLMSSDKTSKLLKASASGRTPDQAGNRSEGNLHNATKGKRNSSLGERTLRHQIAQAPIRHHLMLTARAQTSDCKSSAPPIRARPL